MRSEFLQARHEIVSRMIVDMEDQNPLGSIALRIVGLVSEFSSHSLFTHAAQRQFLFNSRL